MEIKFSLNFAFCDMNPTESSQLPQGATTTTATTHHTSTTTTAQEQLACIRNTDFKESANYHRNFLYCTYIFHRLLL